MPRMPRTSEAEAEEQRKNEHLQGDHHKKAQKVGHGVPASERDGRGSPPPDDTGGGTQTGGERGR